MEAEMGNISSLNRLVYISMGKFNYHRQTIASILTAAWFLQADNSKDIRIVLYTDQPETARRYLSTFAFVEIIPLSDKQIRNWRGPHNYIFRVKIMAILDSMSKAEGKILYLDGDTFIREHPDRLFENISADQVLMYRNEGQLGDESIVDWGLIRNKIPVLNLMLDGSKFPVQNEDFMWNAGVIGVLGMHKELIAKVLNLTDQYCSQTDVNQYHQDQLMFSLLFARTLSLYPGEDLGIYHYCYYRQKGNADRILKSLFSTYSGTDVIELTQKLHETGLLPVPPDPLPVPFWKIPFIFLYNRFIGLSLAIDRVRKSGRIMSFFERGRKY